MQFDTTINDWHTCPNSGRINASNPCSEYMHLDDSACNLASLNLLKFLSDAGEFDTEAFRHAVDVLITAQDIVVDKSSYPTEAITANAKAYRELGLGYANLGAILMSLGLPYDSEGGRQYAAALTAVMCGEAYLQSARIAAHLGPFQADVTERVNHNITTYCSEFPGDPDNDGTPATDQRPAPAFTSQAPPLTTDNLPAVFAQIVGDQLVVTPVNGFTGTARITVTAHDGPNGPNDYRGRTAERSFDVLVPSHVAQTSVIGDNYSEYSSLALDSSGNPHISYVDRTGALTYAVYNGTTWMVQPVMNAGAHVSYTSLELDQSGQPSISYYDFDTGELRYAHYDADTWSVTTVANVNDRPGTVIPLEFNSLALDSTDHPYISYFDYTDNQLRLASYNGTDWNIQTVDNGNAPILGDDFRGIYSSLVLDQSGTPHISYFRLFDNAVKYAEYVDGAWDIQQFGSVGLPGTATSLVLDSAGNPRVSYCDGSSQLMYASYDNGVWTTDPVDNAVDARFFSALDLDSHDAPHISYYDYAHDSLNYASYVDGNWITDVIGATGDVSNADPLVNFKIQYGTSLALDRWDRPHTSYYNATTASLEYGTIVGLGSIYGTVSSDGDGQGTEGITIRLISDYTDTNGIQQWDPGEPYPSSREAITDANGDYSFTDIPLGDYFVAEVAPDSMIESMAVTLSTNSPIATAINFDNSPVVDVRVAGEKAYRVDEGNNGQPVTITATLDPNLSGTGEFNYSWQVARENGFVVFSKGGQVPSGTSTLTYPFIPFDNGQFVVTLTITDSAGRHYSDAAYVFVSNLDPTAALTIPPISEGDDAVLDASGSRDPAGVLDPLTYTFDIDVDGDGKFAGAELGVVSGTMAKPRLSWAELNALGITDGTGQSYDVRVTVSDGDGGQATALASLTVNNAAPTVDIGGPYTIHAGVGSVTFDASGSNDASPDDKAALTYAWDIDLNRDGVYSMDEMGLATEASATFTWEQLTDLGIDDQPRSWSVRLRVSDGEEEASAKTTLEVVNQAPIASAGGPYTIHEGESLTLDGSQSYDADGQLLTFMWDINGNGETDAVGEFATLTWAQLVALGITDGPQTQAIRLHVDDGFGGTDGSTVVTLTVENAPPTAVFNAPVSAFVGEPVVVSFDDATDPSAADVSAGLSYSIDLNNDSDFTDAFDVLDSSTSDVTVTFPRQRNVYDSRPGTRPGRRLYGLYKRSGRR